MSTAEERFAENVLACVDDLNSVLPRLAARYEDLVIVAAMAEHVGGALRIFMQAGICNALQARRVLAHLEETAFAHNLRDACKGSDSVQ
jgi:aminoglycoside phosphotransferase (APT) family kinase protein